MLLVLALHLLSKAAQAGGPEVRWHARLRSKIRLLLSGPLIRIYALSQGRFAQNLGESVT